MAHWLLSDRLRRVRRRRRTGCPARAGRPVEPAALAQGRALYEQISTSIYSTAADRVAAEKQTAARFQGAVARWMKAKSFTYRQYPSEQQNGGPLSPDDLDGITEIGPRGLRIATAKRNQAEVADQVRALNARSTTAPPRHPGINRSPCPAKPSRPDRTGRRG